MRRPLLIGGAVLLLVVAIAAQWFAHRTLTVEPPSLNGPPPEAIAEVRLVGKSMPAFSGVDQFGRSMQAARLRGQVVVVDVWATWCRPCVDEMARLQRDVWQRHGGGVVVVGIGAGETAAKVHAFASAQGITFPLIADPNSTITGEFGGRGAIPRTFLVDRGGRIVDQSVGYGPKIFDHFAAAVDATAAR